MSSDTTPNLIQYDIINPDMDKREFKITVGIRSYWITKEELDKYLKERIKPNVDHVALRGGLLLLPIQYQDVVHKTVIDDSEKVEDGQWQCDAGKWHIRGRNCYCNIEVIETDDRTMRLEERKPDQLPAPTMEENREPPVSRDRRDTFSYNHGAHIKTF